MICYVIRYDAEWLEDVDGEPGISAEFAEDLTGEGTVFAQTVYIYLYIFVFFARLKKVHDTTKVLSLVDAQGVLYHSKSPILKL